MFTMDCWRLYAGHIKIVWRTWDLDEKFKYLNLLKLYSCHQERYRRRLPWHRATQGNIYFCPYYALYTWFGYYVYRTLYRYKEFSEWMIHIDDDEFLAFSPTAKFGGVKVDNLYELVSQISKKDPRTNAVSFYPLCVTDCRMYDNAVNTSRKQPILPRYWKTLCLNEYAVRFSYHIFNMLS